MTPRTILALVLVVVTTGCAPAAPRDAARLSAAFATRVSEDGERFAAFREQLARARLANMHLLETSALRLEQEVDMDLRIWRESGQARRIALYETIRQLSERVEEQAASLRKLREEQERALAEVKTAVVIRSDRLVETAKQLGQLSEERSLKDEIAFLVGFVERAGASVTELEQKAGEQAKNGQDMTKAKSASLQAEIRALTPLGR
jgi:hypothetical protein